MSRGYCKDDIVNRVILSFYMVLALCPVSKRLTNLFFKAGENFCEPCGYSLYPGTAFKYTLEGHVIWLEKHQVRVSSSFLVISFFIDYPLYKEIASSLGIVFSYYQHPDFGFCYDFFFSGRLKNPIISLELGFFVMYNYLYPVNKSYVIH